MRLATDQKAIEREIRALGAEVRELAERHDARMEHRKAAAEAPQRQRRPAKGDRPRCGARCRTKGGAPCLARVVCDRDATGKPRLRAKCRMHGGLSTGPVTAQGKQRVREAAIARKRDAKGRWLRTEEGST